MCSHSVRGWWPWVDVALMAPAATARAIPVGSFCWVDLVNSASSLHDWCRATNVPDLAVRIIVPANAHRWRNAKQSSVIAKSDFGRPRAFSRMHARNRRTRNGSHRGDPTLSRADRCGLSGGEGRRRQVLITAQTDCRAVQVVKPHQGPIYVVHERCWRSLSMYGVVPNAFSCSRLRGFADRLQRRHLLAAVVAVGAESPAAAAHSRPAAEHSC